MSLEGKKVRLHFTNWPVEHGDYTYEGHNEQGHWVRRSDGEQRLFPDEIVQEVTLLEDPQPPSEEA